MIVAREFELVNLSDRLGFGVHTMLGVEDRLLAYFITWTVAFGREEVIDGTSWIRVAGAAAREKRCSSSSTVRQPRLSALWEISRVPVTTSRKTTAL